MPLLVIIGSAIRIHIKHTLQHVDIKKTNTLCNIYIYIFMSIVHAKLIDVY